jgi:predicted DNA-binding protein (UPF0278 family)
LQDEVIQNAESILPSIKINELMKDPESYLLSLGLSFLNEHVDEIEKGAKQGERFAEKILEKSG